METMLFLIGFGLPVLIFAVWMMLLSSELHIYTQNNKHKEEGK